jgi:hypothetical protein
LQDQVGQTGDADPGQVVQSSEVTAPLDQSQDMIPGNVEGAPSMEAISVTDPSQQSKDMEALLKKIDYDPYNEDEVVIFT